MRFANVITIKNHEAVEVVVTDIAQREFFFPDVNNLRNKKITGMETYNSYFILKSPFGRSLVDNSVLGKSYVTFTGIDNKEDIMTMPLPVIRTDFSSGLVRWFDNKILDFSKCFITVGSTTGLVLNTVFLFSFYYED